MWKVQSCHQSKTPSVPRDTSPPAPEFIYLYQSLIECPETWWTSWNVVPQLVIIIFTCHLCSSRRSLICMYLIGQKNTSIPELTLILLVYTFLIAFEGSPKYFVVCGKGVFPMEILSCLKSLMTVFKTFFYFISLIKYPIVQSSKWKWRMTAKI